LAAILKRLGLWLKVYEDEIGLFAWMFALFFLIRSSNIILNNYAETAFLKRYGVEYLPILYMINAIALFVIMGLLTPIMGRISGTRLLSYFFVFCGLTVTVIRFLIPFGLDLLYPLLFLLKAQFEVLLGLMFWNLANDLFNTRQSKRLFPLITAGGVLGQIIGSFGTPLLAKAIMLDNLLLIYLVTTLAGAGFVKRMEGRYPTLLVAEKKKKASTSRTKMIDEFKKILPMMKESVLIKILILITFLPNVVIPILNYQFNFAVDSQFATESGLIHFFGYFRGVLNIISLVILLFVGRMYGRWGLPVALMFHPFNYVLAFLAFLLRFDVFAAVYARMSTMIIRTTINNPARNILMGLFPESYRGVVRPFLRGTVVRIGLFLGSGLILISDKLFHPKYLSLIAIPLVAGWLAAIFFLKRSYASILLDLVSRNMIDLKAMEDMDVEHLFRDKKILAQLTQAFLEARGSRALWYARLLKSLSAPDLDTHLIASIKREDDDIRIDLLELLSSQGGQTVVQTLRALAAPENPNLTVAVIKAANRLEPGLSAGFNYETYIDSRHPEVKAYALIGLHQREPSRYRATIRDWLAAEDADLRRAGVVAAGKSGDISFAAHLKEMLAAKENGSVLPDVLRGLRELGTPDLNDLAVLYLSAPLEPIRMAALEAVEINNTALLKKVIALMGDASESIYDLAKRKIEAAPYQDIQVLVESLSIPHRHVRKGIFKILESLDIKDLDIFRFARSQTESGYQYLAEAERLRSFPEGTQRDLLIDHLNQKRLLQIDNILRVLAVQDNSGQMKIIHRGIFSADSRQQSNALEAVDNVMDRSLVKILMPLIEVSSARESLAVGRRHFALMDANLEQGAVVSRLLANEDWVTVALVLSLIQDSGVEPLNREIVFRLAANENPYVGRMAQSILNQSADQTAIRENSMVSEVSISDKIILLKRIEIFEGLSVSELAAVASITEEMDTPAGDLVIQEGSFGETMYLVIQGEVSVIKDLDGKNELELDRIMSGDYFGEMALFEDVVRSASIRTEEPSRFLALHKEEFKEIVREYPQIALEICKVLGGRIRKLHEKIKTHSASEE